MLRKILLLSLFVSLAFADGLTVSERFAANNNLRIVLGFGTGLHHTPAFAMTPGPYILPSYDAGFGLHHLAGRILLSAPFADGFEILSSINVGGGSYIRYLTKSSSDFGMDALLLDSQIGFRYLHTLKSNFDIGGQFWIGYGGLLIEGLSELGEAWPLHLRVGPAGRLILSENTTLYFALHYTFKNPGQSTPDTELFFEDTVIGGFNKHGLELPLGVCWALSDNLSFFSEIGIELQDFRAQNLGFLVSFSMGLLFDFFLRSNK